MRPFANPTRRPTVGPTWPYPVGGQYARPETGSWVAAGLAALPYGLDYLFGTSDKELAIAQANLSIAQLDAAAKAQAQKNTIYWVAGGAVALLGTILLLRRRK